MKEYRNMVAGTFDEIYSLEKSITTKWEYFQLEGDLPESLNPVILSSWKRCKQNSIDYLKNKAYIEYIDDSLKDKKEQNQFLLDIAKPYMEEFYQSFYDPNVLVMLSDNSGVIIEGKANRQMWSEVEKRHFIPGSNWGELRSGTNAIGTALVEEKPVHVFSSEHYCQGWHSWVCTAAPIRDPLTNQIIAVLDMTSKSELAHEHNLQLVINQALKIEKALGLRLMEDELFDFIQDPLVIFNKEGIVITCNKAARIY